MMLAWIAENLSQLLGFVSKLFPSRASTNNYYNKYSTKIDKSIGKTGKSVANTTIDNSNRNYFYNTSPSAVDQENRQSRVSSSLNLECEIMVNENFESIFSSIATQEFFEKIGHIYRRIGELSAESQGKPIKIHLSIKDGEIINLDIYTKQ